MAGRRRQDSYGRRAKQEGYAARSVYKLAELDRRLSLLRPGHRVLDLGAAPGSWLRYVAERVGPSGLALGLDLQPLRTALPSQARFQQIDVAELDPASLEGAPFDVVLSDMAPRTTGQRHRDQFLSFELYMRGLELARELLRPGGHYIGKIFQGPELDQAREATRHAFERARLMRPDATRKESYELFLVGLSRHGPAAPSEETVIPS